VRDEKGLEWKRKCAVLAGKQNESGIRNNPGAGPPLVSVGTIISEAAPPFVVFERWARRTSPPFICHTAAGSGHES